MNKTQTFLALRNQGLSDEEIASAHHVKLSYVRWLLYQTTPEARAAQKAYRATDRRKETERRHRQTAKGRASKKRRDAAFHRRHRFRLKLAEKYRMTPGDWDRMIVTQAGRCDACSIPMLKPHVDHNHSTGAVRGLICSPCNVVAGFIENERAAKVQAYLQRYE